MRETLFSRFVRCARIILDDPTAFDGMTQAQVYADLRLRSEFLGNSWVASGRTDYSVYQGQQYLFECLWSYIINSRDSVGRGIRWLKRTFPGRVYRTLDYYNGVGLTSLDVARHGWPIDAYNDMALQVLQTRYLFRELGFEPPLNFCDHSFGKYDLMICLEVLEHFPEPLPLVRRLIDHCEDDAAFIETHNFKDPDHAGHFTEYLVNGDIVSDPRKVAKAVSQTLRAAGFKLGYYGWNECPRIWVRGESAKDLPHTYRR